jgi:hypothetical protein
MWEASSPAPRAYVSFRKEPSPEGRGGGMGKATERFYQRSTPYFRSVSNQNELARPLLSSLARGNQWQMQTCLE